MGQAGSRMARHTPACPCQSQSFSPYDSFPAPIAHGRHCEMLRHMPPETAAVLARRSSSGKMYNLPESDSVWRREESAQAAFVAQPLGAISIARLLTGGIHP